jgi:hypothetical protein
MQELRSALASNVQQKQELLDAVEVMKAQLSVQSRLGGADSEKLQATEQQLAELHQELRHTKVCVVRLSCAALLGGPSPGFQPGRCHLRFTLIACL